MNPIRPWLPQGTVYGTLLNFRREFELWSPRMTEAPYKAAPKAPVLYVKTANTFAACGAEVAVPEAVALGATLGLVIGNSESNRPLALAGKALAAMNSGISGLPGVLECVLLNDLSLPHASYYRPAIQYRNRDGFLVCGGASVPARGLDLNALRIDTHVNGARVQTLDLSTLVRGAAALLADVLEFMTLQPGDVLMLGTDCLPDGERPLARAGDRVEIRAAGFEPLVHTLVEESSAAGPPQGAAATSVGVRSS